MSLSVLVIGGYGNFGTIVCRHLAAVEGIELYAAGRDAARLANLAQRFALQTWCGDAHAAGFADTLRQLGIDLVIHTGGPFQGQSYRVAEQCIEAGVHYCDLADCRTFVNGIHVLDAPARAAGVAVLSGCSSVPSLSAALLDEQRQRFARIDRIEHGISSSAKMPGLATVEGVLAYAGQPILQRRGGQPHAVHGWLGLQRRQLPGLGWRWLANVDVPDMDLFGERYGARDLVFKAGPGLMPGALATALLAQARRLGLIADPAPWARRLHRMGTACERFGDGRSALYLEVHGVDHNQLPLRLDIQLNAAREKGQEIPACASVALARKLADSYQPTPGARPCVGEISVAEYLAAIDAPADLQLHVRYQGGA
ncbi:saccharopine dehydrogenase NADP-binding domain-containing protein [Pseudomonas sp. DTU_2021_1001937_2_SI_NGA_ILE_001]|uniref:saccharopine dehydrogenase family protein n=1 Tax=Pseudomonas sp. DTU_2021_1001937_2_SI_NGA_ILE_001 TaxID=3077589 RepID=UPI0028FC2805|nr:saccharopine dehydrogenase NADP-binding domain-containing protein [Pseudomonas sp. DTU_2021_1001937_2_SI_NGA_ILE_001]WNW13432.1 saccharopine dehydrogenase NADP-binding domain-containing protein [Pseudomonas sp. DTU_2021_1001937_2_SI_NGA_ILE_001]